MYRTPRIVAVHCIAQCVRAVLTEIVGTVAVCLPCHRYGTIHFTEHRCTAEYAVLRQRGQTSEFSACLVKISSCDRLLCSVIRQSGAVCRDRTAVLVSQPQFAGAVLVKHRSSITGVVAVYRLRRTPAGITIYRVDQLRIIVVAASFVGTHPDHNRRTVRIAQNGLHIAISVNLQGLQFVAAHCGTIDREHGVSLRRLLTKPIGFSGQIADICRLVCICVKHFRPVERIGRIHPHVAVLVFGSGVKMPCLVCKGFLIFHRTHIDFQTQITGKVNTVYARCGRGSQQLNINRKLCTAISTRTRETADSSAEKSLKFRLYRHFQVCVQGSGA